METTPRAFSSGVSEASFVRTPRGLNDPVFWKSSALRKARPPKARPSVSEDRSGVRCRRPRSLTAAVWIAGGSSDIVAEESDAGGTRMRKVIVIVTLVAGAGITAIPLATPATPPPPAPPPNLSAETARGTFDALPRVNMELANGARVKLKLKGQVELVTQRIVATPGATFGWHNHPGVNVNVIVS